MILRNRFSKGFFYVTLSAEGKYLQIEWALSACYRGVSWWYWWCWLSPITYNATCEAVPGRDCKYQTVNQMLVIFHLILDLLAWPSQADWWLHTGYTHNGCGDWWLVSTRTGSAYTTGHHGDNDNACTCSVLTLKCKIVSHRCETNSGEMALGCALLNICGSVYWILPWSLSWWDSLILKSTTY